MNLFLLMGVIVLMILVAEFLGAISWRDRAVVRSKRPRR